MLFGMELNVYGFVGMIMLVGIVKKNAIMMIDVAIEAERGGATPREAIYRGCLLRFRPIMMTTMAALLGTLPIALASAPAPTPAAAGLAVVAACCSRSSSPSTYAGALLYMEGAQRSLATHSISRVSSGAAPSISHTRPSVLARRPLAEPTTTLSLDASAIAATVKWAERTAPSIQPVTCSGARGEVNGPCAQQGGSLRARRSVLLPAYPAAAAERNLAHATTRPDRRDDRNRDARARRRHARYGARRAQGREPLPMAVVQM